MGYFGSLLNFVNVQEKVRQLEQEGKISEAFEILRKEMSLERDDSVREHFRYEIVLVLKEFIRLSPFDEKYYRLIIKYLYGRSSAKMGTRDQFVLLWRQVRKKNQGQEVDEQALLSQIIKQVRFGIQLAIADSSVDYYQCGPLISVAD